MERKARLSDYYLRLIKLIRELELTRVKERVASDLLLPMTKSNKEIEKLENCIEYFSKQKMSNADILIRLSTESTLLSTKRFSIFLQMIDYEDLFYYFLNMGRKLS